MQILVRLTAAVISPRLMPASMIASSTLEACLEIDGLRPALRANYRTPVEKDLNVNQSPVRRFGDGPYYRRELSRNRRLSRRNVEDQRAEKAIDRYRPAPRRFGI